MIAVGGTSITTSDSNGSYGSEVVWNNNNGNATGGAVSTVETQPAYQSGITLGNGFRATPDVAFDADPNTGVFVYDAADNTGGTHQYRVGGTSLAAPAWAGLIAVADQGRALAGLAPMDGLTATLPRLYQLSSNDFHDIVSGNNGGNSAGVGYDLTTGRGSPVANLLIPDLAGGDTITGRVFQDNNGDGIYNGTDTPFANKTVYLDLNNNGIEDAGEPTAITNASGIYTFSDEIGSLTGVVRLASPPTTGFALVPNTASFTTSYNTAQTVNFAYLPTTYATAVTGTNYTLRLDATGSLEQLLINGISAFSTAISTASSLSFSLAGAGGSLTIDGSNGNPVPSGGITLNGAAGGGDVLTVIGTAAGNDSFTVTSNSITFGANPIAFSNVSSLLLNPGSGTNALAVNSGSVTIPAQSSGGGILARKFSNLTVASGATTQFATATLQSDRTVVVAAALSVSGHLDLGGNDMIVQGGDLTSITSLLAGGYNNGTWTGNGISSSAALADAMHRTALGVIANTLYGGIGQPLFDGQSPGTGDVLIKYTYYGDTNLDGKVDGTDYSRIDAAYLTHATGWYNGNFNYDSSLNGSDYTLIDNAFNTQGSGL